MRSAAIIAGVLLIAAVGASIASCAKSQPTHEATPVVQPNVSSWREVRIYYRDRPSHVPECEYGVLAAIRVTGDYPVEGPYNQGRWDQVKLRVFYLGGDAVIDFRWGRICDVLGCHLDRQGTMIRFTDPHCMY